MPRMDRDRALSFFRTAMESLPFYAVQPWQARLVDLLDEIEIGAIAQVYCDPFVFAVALEYLPREQPLHQRELRVYAPRVDGVRRLAYGPDEQPVGVSYPLSIMGDRTPLSIEQVDFRIEAGEQGALTGRVPFAEPLVPYLRLVSTETRSAIARPAEPLDETLPVFLAALDLGSLDLVRYELPQTIPGNAVRRA